MNRKILLFTFVISLAVNTNSQTACTYPQGFYGIQGPKGCYNNSTIVSSTQMMLNAFGTDPSVIFGYVANRRFFTLFKTDITNKNIFKMLPGAHQGRKIAVDNVLPYDGAYYADASTWSLVPIQPTGTATGRINNLLLSNTITLWFNLRTSTSLGTISLAQDTLITSEQTSCGSGVPIGSPTKWAIPHSIFLVLNGGTVYTNNVNGLLQLADDVLGGVNTTVYIPDRVQALDVITQAFAECRILTGTIPASAVIKNSGQIKESQQPDQSPISLKANPNPSVLNFTITILSPEQNSSIRLKVLDLQGRTIEERTTPANSKIILGENYNSGVYIIQARQGNYIQHLKLMKIPGR